MQAVIPAPRKDLFKKANNVGFGQKVQLFIFRGDGCNRDNAGYGMISLGVQPSLLDFLVEGSTGCLVLIVWTLGQIRKSF